MKYRIESAGQVYEIHVELTGQGYLLRGPDGVPQLIELRARPDGSQHAITPWGELEIVSARRGAELWANIAGRRLNARVERARPTGAAAGGGASAGGVFSPMAGKLLRLEVRAGDVVKAGQPMAVIEAMKMENELLAPFDGVVAEVAVTAPSPVEKGVLIARLEPR